MKKNLSLTAIIISILILIPAVSLAQTQNTANQPNTDTQIQVPSPADPKAQSSTKNGLLFSLTPAYPNTLKPRSFYYEIKPGQTIEDYATIKSTLDYNFELYAADGMQTEQGTWSVKYKTSAQDNIGAWVKFENNSIFALGSNVDNLQKFTISIPADTKEGDYKGGLIIENKEAPGATTANIQYVFRTAVPIQIKVTNNPLPVPRIVKPEEIQANTFSMHPYTYVSLALFLGCMGYFIYANRKEKKANKIK